MLNYEGSKEPGSGLWVNLHWLKIRQFCFQIRPKCSTEFLFFANEINSNDDRAGVKDSLKSQFNYLAMHRI